MASESDGSELFSHDPSGIDYCAPLRPQIQALHVETVKDRVSSSVHGLPQISHASILN